MKPPFYFLSKSLTLDMISSRLTLLSRNQKINDSATTDPIRG
jgi:hypothetical protein